MRRSLGTDQAYAGEFDLSRGAKRACFGAPGSYGKDVETAVPNFGVAPERDERTRSPRCEEFVRRDGDDEERGEAHPSRRGGAAAGRRALPAHAELVGRRRCGIPRPDAA